MMDSVPAPLAAEPATAHVPAGSNDVVQRLRLDDEPHRESDAGQHRAFLMQRAMRAYEQDDLMLARRLYRAILTEYVAEQVTERVGAQLGLAACARARGDAVLARLHVVAALARCSVGRLSTHRQAAQLFAALLSAEESDYVTARQRLMLAGPTSPSSAGLVHEMPTLTHARVLVRLGDTASLAKAAALTDQIIAMEQSPRTAGARGSALVVRALVLATLLEYDDARDALDRAVEICRPERLTRVLLDPGPAIVPLLMDRLWRVPDDSYVASVLIRLAPESVVPRVRPFPRRVSRLDLLTDRERDVLRLMTERLSNKEIAARLVITTATVKRHAASAYRKLGVSGRREAVRHVQALRSRAVEEQVDAPLNVRTVRDPNALLVRDATSRATGGTAQSMGTTPSINRSPRPFPGARQRRSAANAAVQRQALVDEPTARELTVLRLLASRLTNQEIAQELGISPGTVKGHTLNLYQKLQVSGRRRAVERAQALGLLPLMVEGD